MTQLSYWAKCHPRQARAIIVICHIVLIALAIYTGTALSGLSIHLPVSAAYAAAFAFFIAIFMYPRRGNPPARFNKRQRYTLHKSCDIVLALCSFIAVCLIANNWYGDTRPLFAENAIAAAYTKAVAKPTAEEILASLKYRDKRSLTRQEKRILHHEFRKQLLVYAKAKLRHDDEAAAKAVFIILSIIGAIGLTVLLGALACNIACNGSEAAAVILMIVGVTGIVFLLIGVINQIKKHKKSDS